MGLNFRRPTEADHARILTVVDAWWGRPVAELLPHLFFEHFGPTSSIVEDETGQLAGFLVGFLSPGRPGEAYIHFVGVAPERRGSGLGRELYERHARQRRLRGRRLHPRPGWTRGRPGALPTGALSHRR